MSDSGFVDEPPDGQEPSSRAARDRMPSAPPARRPGGAPAGDPDVQSSAGSDAAPTRASHRRPTVAGAVFALVVLALAGFGLFAWSSRVHADDEAAYSELVRQVEVMDRTLTPQGHGEMPPCREAGDGVVTRTYPQSTGPQAAELVGFLTGNGWTRQTSGSPALAHLVRTVGDHTLTIDVEAPSENALVESLTAHSPASSFGCLLR
ncbi:hypothetical protein [Terrabacter sp. NPDC080008]|uniref:hypothetical protein n=1 Tax=Terrabacter sp. NPDC080008 TaxID=3155176 RepID=UPI00344FDD93